MGRLRRANQVLKLDEEIEIAETFPSNSKTPSLLRQGMRGVVMEIDHDGDACIAFSEVGNQWVLKANFIKLRRVDEVSFSDREKMARLEEEKLRCEKEQEEKRIEAEERQ